MSLSHHQHIPSITSPVLVTRVWPIMKVINKFVLDKHLRKQPETRNHLLAWLQDVERHEWNRFTDVLNHFPKAVALKSGREVNFEIQKDSCYLLAVIHYPTQVLSILSIGALEDVLVPRLAKHFQKGN
jgi:mRNA-degrading endonuclease HigB of HigAB toxin-antitoxin module